LMPGKRPEGILLTIMLGIVGAVSASLLGRLAGWYSAGPTTGGIVAPIFGAAIFLLFLIGYRTMVARPTT
jgi:uncharacterized membrane protein YeaQ/YmgE (transglycosylase-associated protein family)